MGEGLVFRLKDRADVPPLFTIARFTARANVLGLLAKHVSQVRLEGLDIKVPPRRDGPKQHTKSDKKPVRFVIDEIIADGTKLADTAEGCMEGASGIRDPPTEALWRRAGRRDVVRRRPDECEAAGRDPQHGEIRAVGSG